MVFRDILPRPVIPMAILTMLALALLLVASSGAAAEDRWWDDLAITEAGSWSDPTGEGTDLRIDTSPDGSKLLMVGFGSPDEVRVVDRDIRTVAILTPPGPNATVSGARWSEAGTWVVAWGRAEGEDRDFLCAWDGSTFEPSDVLFENDTAPLETVHSVLFKSFDQILTVAGRDANGTSRMLIFELSTMDLRSDQPWRDNSTILAHETDSMHLICIEEGGSITTVEEGAWRGEKVHEGRPSMPTASSSPRDGSYPWLMGYEDGTVAIWAGTSTGFERAMALGDGPVEGMSWVKNDLGSYYLLSQPGDDGYSEIAVRIFVNTSFPAVTASDPLKTGAHVTMMVPDPLVPFQVFACFSDGSLVLYNLSVIPDLSPMVTIDYPVEKTEFAENFTARGTIIDDHDSIQWVKVSYDRIGWSEVNWTGDGWSFEVDVSSLKGQNHELFVEVSDGRHTNWTSVEFYLPEERVDDNNRETFFLDHPITYAVVIGTVIYLAWTWVRKKRG